MVVAHGPNGNIEINSQCVQDTESQENHQCEDVAFWKSNLLLVIFVIAVFRFLFIDVSAHLRKSNARNGHDLSRYSFMTKFARRASGHSFFIGEY